MCIWIKCNLTPNSFSCVTSCKVLRQITKRLKGDFSKNIFVFGRPGAVIVSKSHYKSFLCRGDVTPISHSRLHAHYIMQGCQPASSFCNFLKVKRKINNLSKRVLLHISLTIFVGRLAELKSSVCWILTHKLYVSNFINVGTYRKSLYT